MPDCRPIDDIMLTALLPVSHSAPAHPSMTNGLRRFLRGWSHVVEPGGEVYQDVRINSHDEAVGTDVSHAGAPLY